MSRAGILSRLPFVITGNGRDEIIPCRLSLRGGRILPDETISLFFIIAVIRPGFGWKDVDFPRFPSLPRYVGRNKVEK